MARVKAQNRIAQKKRMEIVEATIRKEGWSEEICAKLVTSTGWSRRSIYRDKDQIAKLLATEESVGLPERRALFLQDVRRLREEARTNKSYSPATRLLDLEGKILGLDRVPLPEAVEEDPQAQVDTSLEGVLREVRRLRRQAQAGHSYVAAHQLLDREHEILRDIHSRDEAEKARDLAHLDENAKVEMVTEILNSLPETLRRKVLGAVQVDV